MRADLKDERDVALLIESDTRCGERKGTFIVFNRVHSRDSNRSVGLIARGFVVGGTTIRLNKGLGKMKVMSRDNP